MEIIRSYLKPLIKKIKEPRRFIQVLMGPRQVGKTTLVNQLLSTLKIPGMYVTADAASASGNHWLEHNGR
jgi:predicted AAA+ superfamily ATPase